MSRPHSSPRVGDSPDIKKLQRMIEDLRSMRSVQCATDHPRYGRYSAAVSALLWIIDDLRAEESS